MSRLKLLADPAQAISTDKSLKTWTSAKKRVLQRVAAAAPPMPPPKSHVTQDRTNFTAETVVAVIVAKGAPLSQSSLELVAPGASIKTPAGHRVAGFIHAEGTAVQFIGEGGGVFLSAAIAKREFGAIVATAQGLLHAGQQGKKHAAQRREQTSSSTSSLSASPESKASSSGRGLPTQLKAGIENLSGLSMDNVKVHYNSSQPAQLHALAYAQGTDIHLAPGQEQHLPHEAWHVVQQAQGRVSPTLQMKNGVAINDDRGLEREADVMGSRAINLQTKALRSESFSPNKSLSPNNRQATLQLVKFNKRKNGTISGLSDFPDRPTSNLGEQGQHLTAYVVFEDMFINRLRDKQIHEVPAVLLAILNEIKDLPAMKTGSNQANNLLRYVLQFETALGNFLDEQTICNMIDDILSLRNKVPGTAAQGEGGGHGEAGHSLILEQAETYIRTGEWPSYVDHRVASDQCRSALWRLLDYNPANPTTDAQRNAIAAKIITHFKSIITAYPEVENWLNQRNELLTTFLESHRNDTGMPLTNLSPAELKKIFAIVKIAFR